MARPSRRAATGNRRGVSSVEMALVAPILVVLMFSIIELGFLFASALQVISVARDAARAAAAGEGESLIWQRVTETASGLDTNELTLTLEYQVYLGNGMWDSTWHPLASVGDSNTAPFNALIRATASYNHRLVVPGLFPMLVDDPQAGTKHLSYTVAMPRG